MSIDLNESRVESIDGLPESPVELVQQLLTATVQAAVKGDDEGVSDREYEIVQLVRLLVAHRGGRKGTNGLQPETDDPDATRKEAIEFEAERLFDQYTNSVSCADGAVQAMCFEEIVDFVYELINDRMGV